MNWQVKYALANVPKQANATAELVRGELIRIMTKDRPDVLAAISAADDIGAATASSYKEQYPELDFLCGYRSSCVWDGEAIEFLEQAGIGWGNFGTLMSAVFDGDANTASHKVYKFSDRLLRQNRETRDVHREYDRIHRVTLESGTTIRIGMIADYEPTAEQLRTLWERFGPVDIAWNINPSGEPAPETVDAGHELGCKVMKWDDLRVFLKTA